MPDRTVARLAQLRGRKRAVERLQLLQAGDIRRLALEPQEQMREPLAYAVDVEGREFDIAAL
jgi:hypothetical protein